MKSVIGQFIRGQHVHGATTKTLDVINPALSNVCATLEFATPAQVDDCIDSALVAQQAWSQTSLNKRSQVMLAFQNIVNQRKEELADAICREHGKVFEDALGEIARGLEVIQYACGVPQLLKTDYSDLSGSSISTHSKRQPLGVVVGITPFNFPAMVPLWMFPLAIATGNSFILKPSEQVPTASMILAEMLTEAGCPEGVFSILQGDKDLVSHLISHKDISAVSFVGSSHVAKIVHETASKHGKRVQALGSAKNHCLVMPDADVAQTTRALMGAAYGSAGERCMAISVVVTVDDETADNLISRISDQASTLNVNTPKTPGAEMGPLISSAHLERVRAYIDNGVTEGAALVVDGRNWKFPDELKAGSFIGPSLFDYVTRDMSIYQEEIFGPVLCVVRANSYADALALINDHKYGNGAAIFTESGSVAEDFCNQVQAGMVGVNVPIPVPVAHHSFGGWKQSLYGEHCIYGEEGVRFYTKPKAITARWRTDSNQMSSTFIMPTSG